MAWDSKIWNANARDKIGSNAYQPTRRQTRHNNGAAKCSATDHDVLCRTAGCARSGTTGFFRNLRPSRIVAATAPSTNGTSWPSRRRSACTAQPEAIDGPLVPGLRHTRALGACVCERARSAGRQRRRGDDLRHREYTPTPAVSHAILRYNRGRKTGLADGIVITPSHNPPEDGGFKYNPPHGGPADSSTTTLIQNAGQRISRKRSGRRQADSCSSKRSAPPPRNAHDFVADYVSDLRQRARLRCHPRVGSISASIPWAAPASTTGRPSPSTTVEPDRRERHRRSHLPLHDSRLGRPHPHGPVVALRHAAADRPEGSVRRRRRLRYRSRSAWHRHAERGPAAAQSLPGGVHRLPVRNRPQWTAGRRGRENRRQQQHDRSRDRGELGRKLYEVPVGFKFFVEGFLMARSASSAKKAPALISVARRIGLDHRQRRHHRGAARGRNHRAKRARSGRNLRTSSTSSTAHPSTNASMRLPRDRTGHARETVAPGRPRHELAGEKILRSSPRPPATAIPSAA